MSIKICYLRIDGDTQWGISTGIPRLLELLSDLNIPASFFLTTGADDSWASLPRIFNETGFSRRIFKLRNNYFKLPMKIKTPDYQLIASKIISSGHEIGVHGYNHFHWIRDFKRFTPLKAFKIVKHSIQAFKHRYGIIPPYTGAPGWRMSFAVLELQEKLNFKFSSDTRGLHPFFPRSYRGITLSTPQIPVNQPSLDEILMTGGKFPFKLNHNDVYCAHAEMEGANYLSSFKDFIELNLNQGCKFQLLSEYPLNPDLPRFRVVFRSIPGRTGKVLIAQK